MQIVATFTSTPPLLSADHLQPAWTAAAPLALAYLWNGDAAPATLATTARVLWTPTDLWFAFACAYEELDVDTGAVDTTTRRHGLWDRDVCEAFVWSPAEASAESYKELEVAPTGQWCDIAVRRPRVDVDHEWRSGMATAAAVDAPAGLWRATMRVPFLAFGAVPQRGDAWRANLFRVSRERGERHYLALAPTGAPTPDYHVPQAFVPLVFA